MPKRLEDFLRHLGCNSPWYHEVCSRMSPDSRTGGLLWAFALAHGRRPRFFDGLERPDDVDRAVAEWAKSVNAAPGEIARACRYAAVGFDGAEAAAPDADAVRRRADKSAAAVELGRPMSKDEARLRAEYGLTLREIARRLTAEKAKKEGLSAEGPRQSAAGAVFNVLHGTVAAKDAR